MSARFEVVGMVVRDMEASLAFYRRLGLDIPEDPDPEGHGHVEATLPGGVRIAWDTHEVIRRFDPGWSAPSGAPGMSLAFRVDSPAEVDRLYGELVAAGHDGHLEPFDAFWGQRYATLHDPDGNPVDLFAPLS